jgi:hypothetical protein
MKKSKLLNSTLLALLAVYAVAALAAYLFAIFI